MSFNLISKYLTAKSPKWPQPLIRTRKAYEKAGDAVGQYDTKYMDFSTGTLNFPTDRMKSHYQKLQQKLNEATKNFKQALKEESAKITKDLKDADQDEKVQLKALLTNLKSWEQLI